MYWNVAFYPERRERRDWLIETWDVLKWKISNIRFWNYTRLIETWDVLKCMLIVRSLIRAVRLIETWDVLKWSLPALILAQFMINRNMRCIEIWER